MKFSIVTPCWNSEGLIGDTVRSIAGQRALADPDVSLEYVLVDGASTDRTLEEARSAWTDHPRASMRVVSEPDSGMYDAVAKGLRDADGDVVAYLNAGDYYSAHCLDVVRACFEEFGAEWLTGMRVTYSAGGALISAKVPYRYDRALIRAGHYGVRGAGRFIQQESTFWSGSLMSDALLDRLSGLKLAGDLFLWTEFAQMAQLEVVAAHLGGFRFHGDHLSDAMVKYHEEAKTFLAPPMATGFLRAPLHEVLSWLPVPLRHIVPGAPAIIAWDRDSERWART